MSKLNINVGQTKIYFSFVIMNYSEMLDDILTELNLTDQEFNQLQVYINVNFDDSLNLFKNSSERIQNIALHIIFKCIAIYKSQMVEVCNEFLEKVSEICNEGNYLITANTLKKFYNFSKDINNFKKLTHTIKGDNIIVCLK